MSGASQEPEIFRFPAFFDHLEQRGALDVRDAVESETEIDGLVYHHRGVQVPAHMAMFLWNPGESEMPTFRIELGTVGPRTAWAEFDATRAWDIYLVLFDGGAVIAWMTDEEFSADEADAFPSKSHAILAGRFSFGTFFLFGPDWVEREEWALESSAPGLIQLEDGHVLEPPGGEEFFEVVSEIAPEIHPTNVAPPPSHLGLVDAGISGDA